jgi:hypothetical protein
MRLIHCNSLKLKEFIGDENVPPYAILSHTWGDEEVSYQEMIDAVPETRELKAGFAKIKHCCAQALVDNLEWAWVDT